MRTPVKKAIFPVGGLGTRFLPATKSIPKEMLPVASKPLIQHAFEEAREAGIEQFIFVTGRNKYAISNHFDHEYELQSVLSEKQKEDTLKLVVDWLPEAGHIAYVRQQDPLGLGHAVWCARHFIKNEPFAVLLADELYLSEKSVLSQMCDRYLGTGGNMVAVSQISPDKTGSYGIIDPLKKEGDLFHIRGMVEKPAPERAPSNYAITGRYILQPEIFDFLAQKNKGAGGEIQLTDAMESLLQTQQFFGFEYQGQRFDCGSRIGFLEANIAFSLARDDMRENVKRILKKYTV